MPRQTCSECDKKVADNEFAAELHWITKGHYPKNDKFTYPINAERLDNLLDARAVRTSYNNIFAESETPWKERLTHLFDLEDGWNGPGTLAPTIRPLNNIHLLLTTNPHLPLPHIAPIGDGGVMAEWEDEDKYMLAEVTPEVKFIVVLDVPGNDSEYYLNDLNKVGQILTDAWRGQ